MPCLELERNVRTVQVCYITCRYDVTTEINKLNNIVIPDRSLSVRVKMASCYTSLTNFYKFLLNLIIINYVIAQIDQSRYNRDGIYIPPNPGDRDYKTFTYNNRRYGQYQPHYYYGRGEPIDPRRMGPHDRRYPLDPVSICKIIN